MNTDLDTLAAQLTEWAHGAYDQEAAVKLLIDSGLLYKVAHLAEPREAYDYPGGEARPGAWLDWRLVNQWFSEDGVMSGGERRVIGVALSLAAADAYHAPELSLGDVMTGVDSANARAILAALAHAHSRMTLTEAAPPARDDQWFEGSLPTFHEMVTEARRLLSEAAGTLRSDWPEGAGPATAEQGRRRVEALDAIGAAKHALDRAKSR
ncbi:hypothetical protein [Jiangella muralis]|uniref:hypothetical protein n=1 Tax=Jiangella muralis TaxID=702383 RepID=UPI00069ED135|nr:hypothetical protein [Jiangella muralis]